MEKTCLHCERTDQQVPLLTLAFQGETIFICPQCLPTLIHKPYLLVDQLPGFDPSAIPPHEP